jgi:arabinofuranosyltransferase
MTDERLFYYPTTGLLAARGASLACQHAWVLEARDAVTKTGCSLPPLAIQNQNGCEGRLSAEPPPAPGPPYRAIEALSIGYVGYCLGPEIHIIDLHALSDPLLSRLPAHPRWAPGHLPRTVPGGYLATLESGEPRLSNPVVAEYYRRLSLLTRAPVTEPGRFTEILSFLNTSTNTELAERLRPVYPWPEVSRRIEDGAAWNDPRAIIMTYEGGLSVKFPDGTRGSKLEVSVSGNDRYRFEFYDGTSLVGSFVIAPVASGSGDMNTTVHGLPRQAFDRVVVVGRRGDFRYSLGHMRVLG